MEDDANNDVDATVIINVEDADTIDPVATTDVDEGATAPADDTAPAVTTDRPDRVQSGALANPDRVGPDGSRFWR
jgi:hypothetical protein